MKKKIALITGGSSSELEISLSSASVITNNLDANLFDVYLITIVGSQWIWLDAYKNQVLIDKNDFSLVVRGEKIFFDCVFIAIHGTPGEDGKLQGYFDMLGIPYTACDVFTSAVTFNKFLTNHVVENLGVPTGKLIKLDLGEDYDSGSIIHEIGLPCFVKPNKGGSSIGVTRVSEAEKLADAINMAFLHDDEVLVQQFLPGIEITCGLFLYRNEIHVLPLCEIVSAKAFFDYEAKYTDGMAEEIVPARIDEKLASKCRDISLFLYKKLGCKGVVRFDYILNDNKFYFLEVNTIPGLSENSIVPRMAKNIGLSLNEMFTMLIDEAIQWHRDRKRYFKVQDSD